MILCMDTFGGGRLKALALFSGGLDSLLAIKLIQEAGVEVQPIHFIMPFIDEEGEAATREKLQDLADQLGVKVIFERLGEDYLRILEKPKYGYGKAMNPCLDCHIFFLNRAKTMMGEYGASFLITGEVVGQRPKSQNEGAFPKIDQDTGLAGLIVRPLSVGHLPRTIPEEQGWVDLSHCPSIIGRQRIVQMDLAKKYGLRFQPPGGGCQLTYKEFGRKVMDLLRHEKRIPLAPLVLLNSGRHFRSPNGWKLIVGRNETENRKLMRYFYRQRHIEALTLSKVEIIPGPLALGFGKPEESDSQWMGSIVARYCDLPHGSDAVIRGLSVKPGEKPSRLRLPIRVDKEFGFADAYRID